MLVEHSALNDYRASEGHHGGGGDAAGAPLTHTRGLCLWESYEIIRTGSIQRDAVSGSLFSEGGTVALRARGRKREPRHGSVTAILVLAGMPWLLTGAVLAHELMHAWLRMEGYRELPAHVEEGLCQLMAYLWLEGQGTVVRHLDSVDSNRYVPV